MYGKHCLLIKKTLKILVKKTVTQKLFQFLTYVDIVFFLTLIIFLWVSIKQLPFELKVFSYFETIIFAIGASSLIMAKLYINNTLLFHLLLVVQLVWLSAHYYLVFKGTRISNTVLLASSIFSLVVLWKYTTDWEAQTEKFGGVLYFVSSLLYVGYAILFYANLLFGKIKPKFQYINAAILIYFSTTPVIFLFSKYYYLQGFEGRVILYIFNLIIHMVFLTLIFIETWKTLRPTPKTSST
jgi:hypothetical protein